MRLAAQAINFFAIEFANPEWFPTSTKKEQVSVRLDTSTRPLKNKLIAA